MYNYGTYEYIIVQTPPSDIPSKILPINPQIIKAFFSFKKTPIENTNYDNPKNMINISKSRFRPHFYIFFPNIFEKRHVLKGAIAIIRP